MLEFLFGYVVGESTKGNHQSTKKSYEGGGISTRSLVSIISLIGVVGLLIYLFGDNMFMLYADINHFFTGKEIQLFTECACDRSFQRFGFDLTNTIIIPLFMLMPLVIVHRAILYFDKIDRKKILFSVFEFFVYIGFFDIILPLMHGYLRAA